MSPAGARTGAHIWRAGELPTIRNQKVRKGFDDLANYQQPLQAAGVCLGRAVSRDPAIGAATHRQKGHL
jgi:hypothetical protein